MSDIVTVPAADAAVAGSLDAQATVEAPESTVDGSAADSSSPAEPPAATPEEAVEPSAIEAAPAAAPVSAPSAAAGDLQAAAADAEPMPPPQAAAVQGALPKAATTKQVVLGPRSQSVREGVKLRLNGGCVPGVLPGILLCCAAWLYHGVSHMYEGSQCRSTR